MTLLLLWFLVAFALFTMMGTKFHHYILPAVPPAAMLAGVALDALLGRTDEVEPHARAMTRAAAIGGALVLALLARDLVVNADGARLDGAARFMQLFTYRYDRPWPTSLSLHGPIVATAGVGAAVLIALAVALPRPRRQERNRPHRVEVHRALSEWQPLW